MANRLGVGRRLREETARTASLNWPKGYSTPDEIMVINKSPGKGREGHLWLWCLSSQETHAELSRKVAKHLPVDWVVVNKFLIPCLHAQLFLTLFKLSLSWSISLFVCLLFLTHLRREEWGWVFDCWQGQPTTLCKEIQAQKFRATSLHREWFAQLFYMLNFNKKIKYCC